jgi:hypothetical protein
VELERFLFNYEARTKMITRNQILAMQLLRMREGVFFRMPTDLIKLISNIGFDPDPEGDTAKLLAHVAYGNLIAAKEMLDANPKLIVKSSHTVTPSGLSVRYLTPYECALCAGDPEMAEMIAKYFDGFSNGAAEKEIQDAKCRPHIENMLKHQPYDFTLVLNAIKNASADEVTAALNNTLTEGELCEALEIFRVGITRDKISIGMHFNYQHLMRAFEVYALEYDNLEKSGGNIACDKNRLFFRQVIGFIERNMPAIDHMVFAHGLRDAATNNTPPDRSFTFSDGLPVLPVSTGENARRGLGFNHYILMKSGHRGSGPGHSCDAEQNAGFFGKYINNKYARLADLTHLNRSVFSSVCVIL